MRAHEKHGHHVGQESPTYRVWRTMIARCHRPTAGGYAKYGARGISVCDRWRYSFAAFLADMGERPDGKTLDRIDGGGNYQPGNCRWATWIEQAANRRKAVRHTNREKTHCPQGHEYTPANTGRRKRGERFCRICARAQQAKYAASQR